MATLIKFSWVVEEDEKLFKLFGKCHPYTLALSFPMHSRLSVQRRIHDLKLKQSIKQWTEQDDEILRDLYPDHRTESIVEFALPNHTLHAIRKRAQALKIRKTKSYISYIRSIQKDERAQDSTYLTQENFRVYLLKKGQALIQYVAEREMAMFLKA